MKVCRTCKAKAEDSAELCPMCGRSLSSAKQASSSARRGCLLAAVITLVAALLLGAVGYGVYRLVDTLSQPVRAPVHEYLDAVRDNNLDKAYATLSKSFQRKLPRGDFEEFTRRAPVLAKVKSRNFNRFQVKNDTATINGTVTLEDGTVVSLGFRLVHEEDKWRIESIEGKSVEQPGKEGQTPKPAPNDRQQEKKQEKKQDDSENGQPQNQGEGKSEEIDDGPTLEMPPFIALP